MAAWTDVAIGTDWQDRAIPDQMMQNYIERGLAAEQFGHWQPNSAVTANDLKTIGGQVYRSVKTTTTDATAFANDTFWRIWQVDTGHDLQGRIFPTSGINWAGWRTMQDGLETMCTEFVNDTLAIEGQTATDVPMWTLASWRTKAGLQVDSGFRRSTTSGAPFSYGLMEAGDVIGPWIFDDLQAAMTALKWTKDELPSAVKANMDSWGIRSASGQSTVCATAFSNQGTNWGSATYNQNFDDYYECSRVGLDDAGGGLRFFQGSRARSKAKNSGIPLVKTQGHTDVLFLYGKAPQSKTFNDIDGEGYPADGAWHEVDDMAASTDTEVISAWIGNSAANPVTVAPTLGCPVNTDTNSGVEAREAAWILKWDFSNA